MNQKLSIVMITKDSEKYLEQSLSSCKFADEIIIVDSGSKDKTKKIAEKFGVKFFYYEWQGFAKQKQLAVNLAKNDWIFILDSDEIITDKLREEVLSILENPFKKGYLVPRLNYFFGKPIKRCGLYPDYSLRLFDKNYGKLSNSIVHERVLINGPVGKLKNYLIHYAYESIEEFINKQNRYSTLGAKPNKIKAIFSPAWTFFKLYFLKLGILEGWRGFLISTLYSQYTFWKHIKTQETKER
ncbi:glycosyltransferase family 2 protein [Thermodesulfatator autotrophicus]|uniref:Glycosyl transferase n=1 Tax=Thermodesulfatator autotrophicus TaxID=1795632 RepID=A0A177E6T6_9BACT|nr:glycosyltransferase family 2 protein [Thermodesulfatator autotrophicus]OAG27673.1 glycosyl transferase [Thermodesulfatator autotrophicus]